MSKGKVDSDDARVNFSTFVYKKKKKKMFTYIKQINQFHALHVLYPILTIINYTIIFYS